MAVVMLEMDHRSHFQSLASEIKGLHVFTVECQDVLVTEMG